MTVGTNTGSCPRTNVPLLHGFFHFALLSRAATSHLYSCRGHVNPKIYFFLYYVTSGIVLGLWKSTDCQGTGEEMSHELAEMEDEDI